MQTKRLLQVMGLTAVAILSVGCEETDIFVPGGGGGGFRFAWPSTTAAVEDAETFAIAIFPASGPASGVTFTASLDGGPDITGIRNDGDSVVAFPLEGLTNGSHSLSAQASTGLVTNRVFTVSLVTRPRITDVSHDSAAIGQQITISGQNFAPDNLRTNVFLNGVELPIAGTPTSTQVTVTVLNTHGPARTGLLSVESDRRISREFVQLKVIGSTPTSPRILLLDPSMAPRNAPLVIYGQGIADGDIPFFGTLASSPILLVGADNLGGVVGFVSFGLTIVPSLASRGERFIAIQTAAGTSTSFPFFIE